MFILIIDLNSIQLVTPIHRNVNVINLVMVSLLKLVHHP
jgi:hypothetical protein